MAEQQRPISETSSTASPMPSRRGRWNWLAIARIVWIMLVFALLVIFVVNIPFVYQSLNTFCNQPSPYNCQTGQLTLGNVQALAQLHLSVTSVAALLATLTLVVSVLYWVVGLLIFRRKSQEWMGLIFSLMFVILGAIDVFSFHSTQVPPLVQLLTNFIGNVLLGPLAAVFFVTFPTGRFTPRWTLVVCILILLLFSPLVSSGVSLLALPLIVGVQVYRYVRVYNVAQRQQTKWSVFAIVVDLSIFTISTLLGVLVPGLSAPDSWYQLLVLLNWPLLYMIFLLGLSISILGSRLWDIDVIINRALVYSSLTVLLVALYVGLILALQALVRAVTGSLLQSPIVIVASTLMIAALFQPLRRRLQNIIDRRFYRRKYDAARVLATFSIALRNEVDLDQLREQLLTVVQETMQPTHVSLWLRQPGKAEMPSLQAGRSPFEQAVR